MKITEMSLPSTNGVDAEPHDGRRAVVDFGRDVCGELPDAERREWLVANGIGGYASGTIAGMLTRRYHGLLVAALKPPLGRTLLVSKVEETVSYAGTAYRIGANRWQSGQVDPVGFTHLERFHIDGTIPVWTYACADALIEKRVWMQPDANTTYVRYTVVRSSLPIEISSNVLVNYRDYHGTTRAGDWRMTLDSVSGGLRVSAFDGATPFFILSNDSNIEPAHDWYRDFFLSVEAYRGLDSVEDHLHAATVRTEVSVGESATLVLSTDGEAGLDGAAAFEVRRAYDAALIERSGLKNERPEIGQLVLAADQFVVRRPSRGGDDGRSVIAGYPWFGDWGRDTMIALTGLTLTTRRHEIAAGILRTFGKFVDRGMLPNRFPDASEEAEYNTVDATLWYFEAIRSYVESTGDRSLLRELFPILKDILVHHVGGTRYNIHVDPSDGLLYAGEPGVQLTWMDAKVGDWVVTPRIGKPVEINALWYHALRTMEEFARVLGDPDDEYRKSADRAGQSFARFWRSDLGYCLDVIDGPDGDDEALRPNQIFAVSLTHSPLNADQRRAVVDVCSRRLLTGLGLRSLDRGDNSYIGHYGGGPRERDGAYHQGTVWSWLIGPFVAAHLRTYGDPALARSFLLPLLHHLSDHGLGTVSEIFDGDAPHTPRGCYAQAWSVAELLNAWVITMAPDRAP